MTVSVWTTVLVFPSRHKWGRSICPYSLNVESLTSKSVKHRTKDLFRNDILIIKSNMLELSQNTHYNVSDHKKNPFWIFLLVRNKNNSGMHRCHVPRLFWGISEKCKKKGGKQNSLRNMEETFFTGLWNQLYPLLDNEFLNKAYPSIISANVDWFFKRSKTHRLFGSLQAVVTTTTYSELLRIEFLEQTTVNLKKFTIFNQNTAPKTYHYFVILTLQTIAFHFEGFHFSNQTSHSKNCLFGVFTRTIQFFWSHPISFI